MQMKLIIPFVLMAVASLVTEASSQCINEFTGRDICKEARRISDATASQLPMKISQNMSINSVVAVENIVQFNVMYSYDRSHLEQIAQETGISIDEMKERTADFARGMCQQDMIKAFVRIGGGVKFFYLFSDAEKFIEVKVDECP